MFYQLIAIGGGAALGAICRWQLGLWLNALTPTVPLGTLAANLIGGYLIGVAVAVFALLTDLSPLWRLLIVTGFLGGLTTFSTFSAEVVTLLQAERFGAMLLAIGLHVGGSLLMTVLGMATVSALK
ncbi:camphor resistance protein CrcB [Fluviicoccus keumensis]|uniref:Fluoride-specific ion channel FluC n=1 Tax=Fluviicoccus keumensis TaxID=1435465 RepID=A0A4V2G617_9GAMM|nr:fluoride efflux transporter CrcB [Fluviicoccus keumensis]RZU46966.1 camphor resistance protein CrcB [Fluviicoccus keumensis]HEX5276168.1 fluoride efflux transporter CrcB [Fluviicoccus sp.]